ncbi:MAG: glycosyltransferase, partial [Rhodothermaceae bacterium]|nr:glycosyltransferase [Rhodothermaceae bacterium]
IRGGISSFSGTDDVADGLAYSRANPPAKSDCRELIFTLQRVADPGDEALNRTILQALGRMTLTTADDKPDLNSLLAEARYFRREGKSGNALEMLNSIMQLYPDNQEARRIKVDILESQRRYVEAAELKHGLKKAPAAGFATKADVPHPAGVTPVKKTSDSEPTPGTPDEHVTAADPDKTATEVEAGTSDESAATAEQEAADSEPTPETPDEHVTATGEETADTEQPADTPVEPPAAAGQETAEKTGDVKPAKIRVSIVIPTAIHRKLLLEECLAALSIYTDPFSTELIIVDNASLDDTYDYLDQLEQDGFMNIRVISNRINRGFAAAANQGIKAASGQYICVMHNDVVAASDFTGKLADLMEKNPEYGLIGPVSNRCMNPAQVRQSSKAEGTLAEATIIDSFCMMFRADASPEFDEQYGLAYAEDADICYQLRSNGWKTGIAGQIYAEHYMGSTTLEIGLDTNGPEYWINAAIFNHKWGLQTDLPDFGDIDEVDQLAMLGNLMNTYQPEEDLLDYAKGLMTSETRTKILEGSHDRERLTSLIKALLLLDQRDILRSVEEKMDHYEPDAELALRLIHFYYDRNIYSRCLKYIDACGSKLPVTEKFFRLKIAVGEKDMDKAVDLLTQLMNEAPVHPGIYKLAGDIHKLENNHNESEEFYSLAYQIDPIRFGKSGKTEIAFSDSVL